VGISVPMHTALRLGVRVAERVREINPDATVCLYGLYAALNADYLLEHGADFCIGGECEAPMVALVKALEDEDGSAKNGKRPTVQIDGVIQRGIAARPYLKRLTFSLPVRTALPPLTKYAWLEHKGGRRIVGYVEASRGCLHLCTHCPIPPVYDGRFFVIPESVVLEDIRRLVAAGAKHITFGDPDFLNGPRHSLQIARAMHQEFPEVTFDFTAKVEHILKHRHLISELAQSGCVFVVSAVESLSSTVLKRLDKGHTKDDVAEALMILRNTGISFRPTFVSFTPWGTLDDYI